MKARLQTKRLAEALGIVKGAVHPNRPFVVLDPSEGDGLMVAADNWDIQIRTQVTDADVEEGGRAVVPHRPLAELCSRLDADEVDLVLGEDRLVVVSGATDMRLPLGTVDLPQRPEPEGEAAKIDAVDWESICMVATHAHNGDDRPTLQAVFFEPDLIGATDSYRLAAYHYRSGITSNIPREMITSAPEGVDSVTLAADEKAVKITVGDTTAWGSVMAAEPPKWRTFVESDPPSTSVTVASEPFVDALGRVQITSRTAPGGGRSVRLTPLDDGILLSSVPEASDVFGDCEEFVRASDGELPCEVGANSKFLADLFAAFSADEVTLHIQDAFKPMVAEQLNLRIVVMPLNVPAK